MPQTLHINNDIFADVLNKIQTLSGSQQRFIHEMLASPASRKLTTQKKQLKKSFGLWADRTDIKSSVDVVNDLRNDWSSRLGRLSS